MRHVLLTALLLIIAGLTAFVPLAGAQGGTPGTATTYSEIAPIFQTRCLTCHAGTRPAAGLSLDTYANVMTGAAKGPVVLPGKPAQSELVKRLMGTSNPRMPKNGPPWLSAQQISLVEKWIASGASEK